MSPNKDTIFLQQRNNNNAELTYLVRNTEPFSNYEAKVKERLPWIIDTFPRDLNFYSLDGWAVFSPRGNMVAIINSFNSFNRLLTVDFYTDISGVDSSVVAGFGSADGGIRFYPHSIDVNNIHIKGEFKWDIDKQHFINADGYTIRFAQFKERMPFSVRKRNWETFKSSLEEHKSIRLYSAMDAEQAGYLPHSQYDVFEEARVYTLDFFYAGRDTGYFAIQVADEEYTKVYSKSEYVKFNYVDGKILFTPTGIAKYPSDDNDASKSYFESNPPEPEKVLDFFFSSDGFALLDYYQVSRYRAFKIASLENSSDIWLGYIFIK